MHPYELLARKRRGETLTADEICAVAEGAAQGTWSDAQLAAFLMAAAIRGLNGEETRVLTMAMRDSGECWNLASERKVVCDKHSTGGVGDKISLIYAPLMAEAGLPTAMLVGRTLGHSGGTADKLDGIPGFGLELSKSEALADMDEFGFAVGIATTAIAPSDRKLYALRDQTATVDSLPLITGSIASKKLALGASSLVLDLKAGNGAFLPTTDEARELGTLLVKTCNELGVRTAGVITDMNQPLGQWTGNRVEVLESLDVLEGGGCEDVIEVTLALVLESARLQGYPLDRDDLRKILDSGRAKERFLRWARHRGGSESWLADPKADLAPHEVVIKAVSDGFLCGVATRQVGLLMMEAGAGWTPNSSPDQGIAFRREAVLGEKLEKGQEIGRLYLRRPDEILEKRFQACFTVENQAPTQRNLIIDHIR